jgi:ABC-type nitrate/sulfonate/bicarbonate transport system ATPase subunit
MRQRVAIARALAPRPAALLLDEPFTALDVTLRRRMQQFLRDLWARTGTTMLMVTHDIEEAILVGQRVAVMGGSPANVIEIVDTSLPAVKERHSVAFGELERRLERRVGGGVEGDAPSRGGPIAPAGPARVLPETSATALAKG